MTTITPTPATRVKLTATLTSPFHHGAGSSGNTSVLRTQDVIQPDGTVAAVPFLSAASIRHGLRDALAWHLASTLQIQPGSLTKPQIDLLWTGGAVSSTGARINLDLYRRVDEYLPMLTMLGYAAVSDIITGTLRASDMILDCAENAHRTGADPDSVRRASAYRSEEFGTRHDQAASPAGQYISLAAGDEATTVQMIWDTQVLASGARLVGDVSLAPAASEQHRTVLGAALHLWAPDGEAHLGAKTAQGYGRATITGPDWQQCAAACDEWTAHITEHADTIRGLLAELAG
ncbi:MULTISPECIES: hypothetical protein [Corynebacterium]|uniref:hypothetical protein n=1 Tax=Corynebacterium TaxID=1716 RepID=UPI00124BFB3B|nr:MULTISPECIES: hypothetical protein [Corynebacterium]